MESLLLPNGDYHKPFVIRNEEQTRLITAWYAALVDPNIEQAYQTLRSDDAFCCLGVQCNVFDADSWSPVDDVRADWSFRNNIQLPPNEVSASMATSNNPAFVVSTDRSDPHPQPILGCYGRFVFIRATGLNDEHNFTLKEIGKLVKDQLIDRRGTGTARSCEILAEIMESEQA